MNFSIEKNDRSFECNLWERGDQRRVYIQRAGEYGKDLTADLVKGRIYGRESLKFIKSEIKIEDILVALENHQSVGIVEDGGQDRIGYDAEGKKVVL